MTALTTVALRLATQRWVLADGRSARDRVDPSGSLTRRGPSTFLRYITFSLTNHVRDGARGILMGSEIALLFVLTLFLYFGACSREIEMSDI